MRPQSGDTKPRTASRSAVSPASVTSSVHPGPLAGRHTEGTDVTRPPLALLLVRLAQITQTVVEREVLAPNGVTWNEYLVLTVIVGNPHINSTATAARTGLPKATLNGVVSRLDARDLVSAATPDTDRRQVQLTATVPGISLWRALSTGVSDAERRLVQTPAAGRPLGTLSRRIATKLAYA